MNAMTSTRQSGRPRPIPHSGAPRGHLSIVGDSGTRILLVGEAARTERARKSLTDPGRRAGEVAETFSVTEASRWVAEGSFAVVVLIAPLRGVTLERAISLLVASSPEDATPALLALVPERYREERVRGLYRRGVFGVFAWPDDVGLLERLIEKAVATPVPLPDHAMETAVRLRLRERLRRIADRVALETTGGVARLSGRVSSLWAKHALRRQVSRSPGIEQIDDALLSVERSDHSDERIGREVRALLEGATTIDASTLGVSVHDGRVVLMGTVVEDERDRVVELISMVPGVLSLTDRAEASPTEKRRAAALAEKLEREIQDAGAGRGLRVAVVGATAILRGVGSVEDILRALSRLGRRKEEADDAEGDADIRRVVHRARPSLQRA